MAASKTKVGLRTSDIACKEAFGPGAFGSYEYHGKCVLDKRIPGAENLKGTWYAPFPPAPHPSLPEDDASRGKAPMFDGLVAYFPNALAYVAEVSKIGSDKHNVGQPMHWARGKSMDHGNKIMRHQVDAGLKDADGVRHSGYVAWRALAQLQEELERDEGYPMSRGSKVNG